MSTHTLAPRTFASLGVPPEIVTRLAAQELTTAFPIQIETLPDSLKGRDILGRGKTGSGKTLAFSIPLVARLGGKKITLVKGRKPRALVLAPTRELATQIHAVIAPLARAYGLQSTTVFGGVPQSRQAHAIRDGVDIIVACPGRLEDLMRQHLLTLDAIEITVLDEADHMADLGFLPCVKRILEATPHNGQRMLFSATLDGDVDAIVKRFLPNAVRHETDEASTPSVQMRHHIYELDSADEKRRMITSLASGMGRRILFTRTKRQASKIAEQLAEAGIPAVDLHGNLNQRQRDKNLAAFQGEDVRVLVATDVAARGVHVDNVELVVHVDPPAEHKAYLHRSGRTARAGGSGDVVTLVLPDQRRDTATLLRKASIDAKPIRVNSRSIEVTDLIGKVAAFVKPSPKRDTPAVTERRYRPEGARAEGSGGRPAGGGRTAFGRSEAQGGSRRGATSAGSAMRRGR